MTSSDDEVLGGSNESDERKSGHPDSTNRRTRSRIGDADGAIVTIGSVLNTMCMEGSKIGSPADAMTSPDEEKETVFTQPPAGLVNLPQTLSSGSFSPQSVGVDLNTIVSLL